ncbi:hypothetical protein BKA70DRAFT_1030448, partial [Coprinopsis sp. MPI-PUGE-AT-0042]
KFLALLHAKRLKNLTLGCFSPEDLTNPAFIFNHLGRQERYTHLQQIKIHQIFNGNAYKPSWIGLTAQDTFLIEESTARSLHPFKDLTSLFIGPCALPQISDSDLLEMFSYWPKLQSFELEETHLYEDLDTPELTLAEVHNAVRLVPELERLTLSFDGSILPPAPPSPSDSQSSLQHPHKPHQALRYWNVCASNITHPTRFSKWLTSNYPALSQIEYFGTYLLGLREVY